MPVYAHCPSCGLDFESEGFRFVTLNNVMLEDINEECPRCGQAAAVMEGTFNSTSQYTEVLNGPQWSRELVMRMQARFREIDKIALSPRLADVDAKAKIQQILAEVESTNPAVATEFRTRTEGQPRKAWSPAAKAITAALAAIGAYNTFADFSDRVAGLITYFSQ